MARALFGYVGTPSKQHLELEIARLQARVRVLEAQVSDLRAEAAARHLVDSAVGSEIERMTAEAALSTSGR